MCSSRANGGGFATGPTSAVRTALVLTCVTLLGVGGGDGTAELAMDSTLGTLAGGALIAGLPVGITDPDGLELGAALNGGLGIILEVGAACNGVLGIMLNIGAVARECGACRGAFHGALMVVSLDG